MRITKTLLRHLIATADRYIQRHRPNADLQVTGIVIDNQVQLRCLTQIDGGARYLLILRAQSDESVPLGEPIYLLVPGHDLYNCATADYQGHDLRCG